MEMSGEDLFRNIKHEDLKLYFRGIFKGRSKKQMIVEISHLLASDESAKKAFYDRFANEIALHPTDLEQVLQCTKPERLRWTEEGKLPVIRYSVFRRGGKDNPVPMFDRWFVENLPEETIEQWKFEYEQQKTDNRKRGAQEALSTRIVNDEIRNAFDEEFNARLERWNAIDQGLAATLSLCYWTMWISRWAKKYKILKKEKPNERYEYMDKALYELKEKALSLLVNNPSAHLSFCLGKPGEKDKGIHFCKDHNESFSCSEMSKMEYYLSDRDEIDECPNCDVDTEHDLLYSLRVCDDRIPNDSFSFHAPYSDYKWIFPDPKELAKVEHEENEFGNFRFGREIRGDEEIGRREKDVAERFNDAYQNYLSYFPQR